MKKSSENHLRIRRITQIHKIRINVEATRLGSDEVLEERLKSDSIHHPAPAASSRRTHLLTASLMEDEHSTQGHTTKKPVKEPL